MFGSLWCTARTGCGVVVVADDGTLIAYGNAVPPSWVRTSGGAEAWTLYLVLRELPFVPRLVADYFSLLVTARRALPGRQRVADRSQECRILSET